MTDRKQHQLHGSMRTGVMLAFCFWLCSWALIGCGSSPHADRPLMGSFTAPATRAIPAAMASVGTRIQAIEVLAAQSNLASYPNGLMDLTIVTSPFAICNFIVNYGLDKISNSFGIVPVTADAKGLATWHWQVEGKAATGTWPLAITASLVNGPHTTPRINITVNLPPITL